jgi:hypothetical protein
MSEGDVLALVESYPHPSALARHMRDETLFPVLLRLEGRGLVRSRGGLYRLTGRGRDELAAVQSLRRLVARALYAAA